MKVNILKNLRTVIVIMIFICIILIGTIGWIDHKGLEVALAILLMIVTNSLNEISSICDEVTDLEKRDKW